MNIKVINDEGIGSDESVILGIDKVCDLAEAARTKVSGLPMNFILTSSTSHLAVKTMVIPTTL